MTEQIANPQPQSKYADVPKGGLDVNQWGFRLWDAFAEFCASSWMYRGDGWQVIGTPADWLRELAVQSNLEMTGKRPEDGIREVIDPEMREHYELIAAGEDVLGYAGKINYVAVRVRSVQSAAQHTAPTADIPADVSWRPPQLTGYADFNIGNRGRPGYDRSAVLQDFITLNEGKETWCTEETFLKKLKECFDNKYPGKLDDRVIADFRNDSLRRLMPRLRGMIPQEPISLESKYLRPDIAICEGLIIWMLQNGALPFDGAVFISTIQSIAADVGLLGKDPRFDTCESTGNYVRQHLEILWGNHYQGK